MGRCLSWIKKEAVLSAAWALALLSMFLIPPSPAYFSYLDLHTLGLLLGMMAVMSGLQGLGLFRRLGELLLRRTKNSRQLEGVLILLCFFSSMGITNDVALLTFVPFGLEALRLAGQEDRFIPVVTAQTIAANLGSMASPVGNPHNLYLFAHYRMDLGGFLACVLPTTALSLALLLLFLLLQKPRPLPLAQGEEAPPLDRRRTAAYLLLFAICLGAVGRWIPVPLLLLLVLPASYFLLPKSLAGVDYSLLLTFAGFFIFIGNLKQLPALNALLQSLIQGREIWCAVLASQVISNVPAAVLLSGFTQDGAALILGSNLGGLGTLIASMASLISFKAVARTYPHRKGAYLLYFTAANLVFLALLCLPILLWLPSPL